MWLRRCQHASSADQPPCGVPIFPMHLRTRAERPVRVIHVEQLSSAFGAFETSHQ